MDTSIAAVLVAVILVVLVIAVKLLGGGAKGNKVVLCGNCNSGKTCLYMRLQHDRFIPSYTSMKPNDAMIDIEDKDKKRSVQVIDWPGHLQMRPRLIDSLAGCAAVVCVMDSGDAITAAKDTASLLVEVLSQEAISKTKCPVLVACNKSDLPACITTTKTQKLLEDEMNKLRLAQSSLKDISGSHSSVKLFTDEAFTFGGIKNHVHFAACSCKEGEIQVVQDFIQKHTA